MIGTRKSSRFVETCFRLVDDLIGDAPYCGFCLILFLNFGNIFNTERRSFAANCPCKENICVNN